MTSLLLICYSFPPYPGVGGRRWAKFAKYLSKNEFVVHVICARNPFNNASIYTRDVDHKGIISHQLDPNYPKILLTTPKGILQKVNYRLSKSKLERRVKGSIYDRSVFWEFQVLKKASELINEHKISTVIATGAPFRINYYATKLKEKFPGLKVINDLRDPWTWGVAYGFSELDEERRAHEEYLERQVMEHSDVVSVPVEQMTRHLKEKYPIINEKIVLLHHGYDPEEIVLNSATERKKGKLIMYGTLYPLQDESYKALADAISENNYTLDIYSSSDKYLDIFRSKALLQKKVSYHQPIQPSDLFAVVAKSSAVMIMQPDNAIDYITTKIYEIVYSKTPILYIGKKGQLWEFIEKNQLGACIAPNQLSSQTLREAMGELENLKCTYDVSGYSYVALTKQLINMIKN